MDVNGVIQLNAETSRQGVIKVAEVMERDARLKEWRARARRMDQIELDNALWCWRQAKGPAEREAVRQELGGILIPYWEAKRQAIQEGWARHWAWKRARR